jgi:hypothetical protein
MSYCRFSDADIYLYDDVGGYINCCACSIAPKHNTLFTTGGKLFGKKIRPCKYCTGSGCDHCMMHGDTHLFTASEALEHVKAHRERGDNVPDYVDERLLEEQAKEKMTRPRALDAAELTCTFLRNRL